MLHLYTFCNDVCNGYKPTVQIIIIQKQQDNVEYFNYLGSMTTHYSRWKSEIKSSIARKNRTEGEEGSFHQQIRIKFKKLVKCYIWGIVLYGAENWDLGK